MTSSPESEPTPPPRRLTRSGDDRKLAMQGNLAARAGRWSANHRKQAIFGWFAFVIVATLLGGLVGTRIAPQEDFGSGQSQVADRAIAGGFPQKASEQVLVQVEGDGTVTGTQGSAAIAELTRQLATVPHVEDVRSPLASANGGQIAADGRSAVVGFSLIGDAEALTERVDASLAVTAAVQRAHPELRVEQFGDASGTKALERALADDFSKAERMSLPITLVILVLAFGALVAAGLPLLLGMTSVIATIGLLGPISQVVPFGEGFESIVLLIGLAVGVDYSMFYLRREMEERDDGKTPPAALAAAAATSGRAVLISGLTVMIAMAGMFFAGNNTFVGIAVATMLVVAVAMIGSLTFLPAMLSWLGEKGWTEKGRVPYLGRLRHRTHDRSRLWGFILDRVLRHPVVAAVAATTVLVALSIPALGMKTINPGLQGLPHDLPIMQTYERIQTAFPGGPMPATVVVQADDVTGASVREGVAALRVEALATGHGAEPFTVSVSPDRTVAIVSLALPGMGTDAASERALTALRDDVIPSTIGAVDGVEVNVSGLTAVSKDFNDSTNAHMPIVFAFVLGLAFVLLLVTFRSLVVPIKAIVLNLLSVGASYGVLKLVFQDGHGEKLLGFESLGGIVSWLPLFLFVILFGLSMDYHVFIISRIREAVDRGMTTDEAVADGIKSTAGVVTSAAAVMIAVFSVFATLSSLDVKQMGVGMAVAILIDATIVRAVLLPATMKLLGDWNWYLPKRLGWLPTLEHEPSVAPARA